jgi:hypothetical protein
MYDPVHVRPHAVDQQVHADFAGDLATALQFSAAHINDDEIGGLHRTFGHRCRSDQDFIAIQAHGQVAVAGGDVAALVQHFAYVDNLAPRVQLARHVELSSPRMVAQVQSGNNRKLC